MKTNRTVVHYSLFRTTGLIRAISLGLLLMGASGCATYQAKVSTARDEMRAGQAAKAAEDLKKEADEDGRDQLVYLLDYATALQQAGNFKESAKAYGKAEKIADIQDYHSISRVTSSLLLSEEMVQYKGDDYEKVLINALNAINYLELGELDDALVEVRKLNQKLYKYKTEAKKNYEQNPFAFYLAALIYEADRRWDDAYISYKSAYAVDPGFQPLHEDLVRAAIRAQRPDDVADWLKKFPEVKVDPKWKDSTRGEIVLLLLQGWGPRKKPRPESPRFPMLVPTYSRTQSARLIVEGGGSDQTSEIFSVQDVAIKTLNDDFARLVASRVVGVGAKAVVADQLRQKNELLGAVAWIAMNLSDRADLRQWSTLPEGFQIARISVKAGKYQVSAQGLDAGNSSSGESMPAKEVIVKPGQKAFVSWRTLR